MKKEMVLAILVGALCAMVLSCGSSGGGGAASGNAGEVFVGNWTWSPEEDAEDTSTCFMVIAEEVIGGQTVTTYAFSGTVTNDKQYGLGQWSITPADEETLEKLRTAKNISFKIIGDGNRYQVEIPITTVKDWGFHVRNINTEPAGTMIEQDLMIRSFSQPGWAVTVPFRQNLVTRINIKTRNNAEGGLGDYSVKIWDLKLHM
jgi:hypothetical protein